MAKNLTALRERFCQEYVTNPTGGASAAYARARGHPVAGSRQRAPVLLKDPRVQARIAELRSAIVKRNEVTQDELIDRLRENIQRAADDRDGHVVNKAVELLGKMIGMFSDKVAGTVQHDHQHRHDHYDARVPLTEDERRNRLAAILAGQRN
jgi:hypothetical protein